MPEPEPRTVVASTGISFQVPGFAKVRIDTPVKDAPFVDAASWIDPTSFENTFISYYTWGAGIGLALDLSIRARFPGRSLDDFMRAMWRRHGVQQENQTPLRPYTIDDLRTTLGETVGDTAFANDFFELNPFDPTERYGWGRFVFQGRQLWVLVVGWVLVGLAVALIWRLVSSPW